MIFILYLVGICLVLFVLTVIVSMLLTGFACFVESDWAKENLDTDKINKDFNSFCERIVKCFFGFVTTIYGLNKYKKDKDN